MSGYTIVPIESPEDETRVKTLARRVFGAGGSLLLPRKRPWGFYAHRDGNVVGGAYLDQVGRQEGMFSWIFVDPAAQGHKLGRRLTETGIRAMEERGLMTQFTLIRDDNTASWNMFAKHGYTQPSVLRSLFGYSPASFMKRLGYAFATGYSTWVKDDRRPGGSVHPRRWAIAKTLTFSLFIGGALSLFSLRGIEFFYLAVAMVLGITALRMAVAYPIARLSGPVRFDAPQGGTALSVILAVAFGSWWPAFGYFVPNEDFWRDRDFRRHSGLQALATWMSMVVVSAGLSRLFPVVFHSGMSTFFDIVIIYQMIPVFPFDGMDGAKVLNYSKTLYVIGLVASVLALVLF
ncbi:MAG TPA: GNAT family N-acetyltransferase [Alkalispirochaeta sp.]|nr:GNAT family N-acetyltransferase [Alkalispirochaeta sp.]